VCEPYGPKCAVITQEGGDRVQKVIFTQRKCHMHECITNYYVNVNFNVWMLFAKDDTVI